jgi:heme/copper-type cytochrome/quinol oxidase subunit 4
VVGYGLKADVKSDNEGVVSVMYASSAVLAFAGLFVVQRLHERKRCRGKQIGKIVEEWTKDYPRTEKIDIICLGKSINDRSTSNADVKKNWMPILFGSFSATAVGFALLTILYVVLVPVGVLAVPSWWAKVLFLCALAVGTALVVLLSWWHHSRDEDLISAVNPSHL